MGEAQPRKIASGLRDHLPVEDFKGQKVLVLCNMKEKKLRGFGSHGMILCGKKIENGVEKIELVKPPGGTKVSCLLFGLTELGGNYCRYNMQ